MVEAVVVLLFFMIIFAGVGYLGRLYGTRQVVGAEARKCAWAYAIADCDGQSAAMPSECAPGDGGPAGSFTTGDIEDFPDSDDHAGKLWSKQDSQYKFNDDFGSTVATVERQAPGASFFGLGSKKITASTKVMCNEKRREDDPFDIAAGAWDILTNP